MIPTTAHTGTTVIKKRKKQRKVKKTIKNIPDESRSKINSVQLIEIVK